MLACYSNRAACRLHLSELLLCAEDCTHALAIMARANPHPNPSPNPNPDPNPNPNPQPNQARARAVTEFPKTEAALQRARLRLLTRRAAAYPNPHPPH